MASHTRRRLLLVGMGFVGWMTAGFLLSGRIHSVYRYEVLEEPVLFDGKLAVLALVGLLLTAGAWRAAEATATGRIARVAPAWWLGSCGVISLLEGLRCVGFPIPVSFFEPLLFAWASGMAALAAFPSGIPREGLFGSAVARVPWLWCVVAAAVACGTWWYFQGATAYAQYCLGFADFADFARRVADTWEGRGFLARSPVWPPFFDHFNPGLVLLVPLWPLWPDARLFMLVQAVCLSLPALFVYAIARRLGAERMGAAAWALAYLLCPAVGQLNLCNSYGFHAVSLALPCLFASAWACLSGRRWLALGLAIVACTFKENVPAVLAGLAFALAVLEVVQRRAVQRDDTQGNPSNARPGLTGVKPYQWCIVAVGFGLIFALITRCAGISGTGTWQFARFGGSFGTLLLSAFSRPLVFWGEVFKLRSIYYLLAICVPVGLPSLVRGWPVLIALIAPLTVLLTWDFDGATSLAMQYVTLLTPIVFLAGMVGAARCPWRGTDRRQTLTRFGVLAATSGLVASFFMGALPFSRETIPFALTAPEAEALAPHHAALDRAVKMADRGAAAVLASGRLAAHFLGVRRLELLTFALWRQDQLRREAGPNKSWIEVFDFVVVDLNDVKLHHSLEETRTCVLAAEAAGYRAQFAQSGVLVYVRPASQSAPGIDTLAPWRVSAEEARGLRLRHDPRALAPGVCLLQADMRLLDDPGDPDFRQLAVELIIQATRDQPAECGFRHALALRDGSVVADSGLRLPAEGNRPISFWRNGEAWRVRYTLRLPKSVQLAELTYRLESEPLGQPEDQDAGIGSR